MDRTILLKGLLVSVLGAALFLAGQAGQVYAQSGNGFEVSKKARNLTQENMDWADSVAAAPGDRVEFQVVVTWRGASATDNVLVRDMLSEKMHNVQNLHLEGSAIGGNITEENINVGSLEPNQSKTITFEAELVGENQLAAGTSTLLNTATVFNNQGGASAAASVRASREGSPSPTDIATGALHIVFIALALVLAAAFLASYVFLARYYFSREVLASKYENRADRKLASLVERAQKQGQGMR